MYFFGERSKKHLDTCHPKLVALFNEVITITDCSVIMGHRNKTLQDEALHSGFSTKKWPDGKHNKLPSEAVDVIPWPHYGWKQLDRFYHFAGIVRGVAAMLQIPIRWGGDWDGDFDLNDQTLFDLVHFELITRGKK